MTDYARQRQFLNRYYGVARQFYDVTRTHYLFGRDELIDELAGESWSRLVEIGPGTGRNLERLRTRKPGALLGGVEASDAMLEYARARLPGLQWMQGFAEKADYANLVGAPPDRILFSYSLSMMERPIEALQRARTFLADDGEIALVDFGDLRGLPEPFARVLRAWLDVFHVEPVEDGYLDPFTDQIEYGPGRYFVRANIPAGR